MTAHASSGDRPALRPLLLTASAAAAVSALLVAWTVSAAPQSARTPLAWGGGIGAALLCAAVTVAAHGLRAARTARTRADVLGAEAARLAAEREALGVQWRRRQEHQAQQAEHQRALLAGEFDRERERLRQEGRAERERLEQDVRRLAAEADRAAADRAAAISATANAAARMQALATGTLADLRAMEERHSDEDVLADLLHLDHRTAQAGRLADSVAVLTGARSGRRWARPIPMESVLRGAMGRISGYQRVRLHAVSGAAVVGHAAEGVMHALAELMDNAATFSPPSAEVHVYVEEVPTGVIVSVEDSGLVMSEVQLRRAERAVAGETSELGGLTGTRLGLAVVGRLARKHGLKVSFRPSARGGTGVLVLLPQSILAQAPAAAAVRPAPDTRPPAAGPAESGRAGQNPPAAPRTAHGRAGQDPAGPAKPAGPAEPSPGRLPKRRRGHTLAAAERSRARDDGPRPASAGDLRAGAARFGDFRRAVRPAGSATETTGSHPRPAPPDGPGAGPRPDAASDDRDNHHRSPAPADGPDARTRPGAPSPDGPARSYPEGDPTS